MCSISSKVVIVLQAKGSRNQDPLGHQSLPTISGDVNAYDARNKASSDVVDVV